MRRGTRTSGLGQRGRSGAASHVAAALVTTVGTSTALYISSQRIHQLHRPHLARIRLANGGEGRYAVSSPLQLKRGRACAPYVNRHGKSRRLGGCEPPIWGGVAFAREQAKPAGLSAQPRSRCWRRRSMRSALGGWLRVVIQTKRIGMSYRSTFSSRNLASWSACPRRAA